MRNISDIFNTNRSIIPQVGDSLLIDGEILDNNKNNFTIGHTSIVGGVKINSENLEDLLLVCKYIGTKEVNIPSLLIINGDGILDFNKINIIPKGYVHIKNPTNNKECVIKNWIISTKTISISFFEKLVFENCKISCNSLEIDDKNGKIPQLIKSNIKTKELIIKPTSISENSRFTNIIRDIHRKNCSPSEYNIFIDELGVNQINCKHLKFSDLNSNSVNFVKTNDAWVFVKS